MTDKMVEQKMKIAYEHKIKVMTEKDPRSLKITVTIEGENKILMIEWRGRLGVIRKGIKIRRGVRIEIDNVRNEIIVKSEWGNKKKVKMWVGMVDGILESGRWGVIRGYKRGIRCVGIGYRIEDVRLINQRLPDGTIEGRYEVEMNVGTRGKERYSWEAEGIEIIKLDKTGLIVNGVDKEKVNRIASEIRKIRAPNKYKGDGIKYESEVLRSKRRGI